jgi:hypothetical protein
VNLDLPRVPQVDADLVAAHREAHLGLEERLRSAHPGVSRLLTALAHRTTVASVAHVRMSVRGRARPPLFPPPRSFLSPKDRARLAGAAAAYRHLDSRLTMVREGFDVPPALRPETPYVLHALAEGRMDNPIETNPGMIRGREYPVDRLPMAPYPPPPRERCRELLDGAIHVAATAEAPAIVRAGWLLFTIGEIHPFHDGNGRVARLLLLLVAGEDMPRTVDWGVSEQIRFHQEVYLASLVHRDPEPSVFTVMELSVQGAGLMSERLAALGVLVPELARRLGITFEASVMTTAAWLRRSGRLDELASDAGRRYPEAVAVAEALASHGVLVRQPRPPGPADSLPLRPVYALSVAADAEVRNLLDLLETG